MTMKYQMWEKKIKVSSNATKLWLNLILVLLNVIMEPSNTTKKKKKKKRTNEYDKSIVTYDVSTAQYENSTVKCDIFVT